MSEYRQSVHEAADRVRAALAALEAAVDAGADPDDPADYERLQALLWAVQEAAGAEGIADSVFPLA